MTEDAGHAERGAADRDETHFGFATVSRKEKQSRVRALFDRVATRYDLMNDVMSLGVHRLWKREMIAWLAPRADQHIVDVAGGTGDIAMGILHASTGARLTVCDLSPAMLAAGRDRAADRGIFAQIDWVCASAEQLPLGDACADAYTIAFGMRNVADPARALAEAARILRPGGRFLCLEFSQLRDPALARLYDAYSFRLLPLYGRVIAGDADAYRYLAESIRRFPEREEFARMIAEAGLAGVRVRTLSFGIAALHSAWRA